MDGNSGELEGGDKSEHPEENELNGKVEHGQSKDGKIGHVESIGQLRSTLGTSAAPREPKGRTKKKLVKKNKISAGFKFQEKCKRFGATVKTLWDVWSKFTTKNTQEPSASVSAKTLGVPGFDEIACIEAEVPDIMMMDKDRVRTSCKECMRDPPNFPSKEQIKAKLIAADKYYRVKKDKSRIDTSEAFLEHEADYYDIDGTVVRPGWRFILERPLVEQYVLMTNYIRKVSVLSEMRGNKASKKYIEEEDSGSDTEYKKFEQKFIKEKREFLKPILKPKTQDIGVQTASEPKQDKTDHESISELSLYPDSDESTNSPEASAVTIVTSRDFTSPLQSDFDARTDKSNSLRSGNWWESQPCLPSESFQTYDSFYTSSGSDGQCVGVHSTCGKTVLQPAQEFVNENDSQIVLHSRMVEPATHRKLKDSKKVSFSSVVTYYQGSKKTGALYNLLEDVDPQIDAKPMDEQQGISNNQQQGQFDLEEDGKPVDPDVETNQNKLEKKKDNLGNILQDAKPGQLVSVSLPADSHKNRIFQNKMMNIVISRTVAVNAPVHKKGSFQQFEEIPDLQYSDPQFVKIQDKMDANIQTHMKCAPNETLKLREPLKPPQNVETSNDPIKCKNPDDERTSRMMIYLNGSTHSSDLDQLRRPGHEEIERTRAEKTFQAFNSSRPSSITKRKADQGRTPEIAISHTLDTPSSLTDIPKLQLQIEDAEATNLRKMMPDQSNKNPKRINVSTISHSQQPQSTESEGPSSSSNEHIKLKPSPACFFKVATPTDLSKISADDFYPDVPEIDAELSQVTETKTSSAPCVEIVFANKETSLRCSQDEEFHRITRKDESTLQRATKPGGESPQNDSGKDTIVTSPGVGIKIYKRPVDSGKDKMQTNSTNHHLVVDKASTKNSSQQSTITQCPSGSVKAKQSRRECEEGAIIPKETATMDDKTHRAISIKPVQEEGVTLKIEECKPTNLKEQNGTSTESTSVDILSAKIPQVTNERESSNISVHSAGPSRLSHKDPSQEEIEELQQGNQPTNEDYDATQIQSQLASFPTDQTNWRTKTYMRTLSTLVEESSSQSVSSSSTQEKPVIAWSVDELKTIFEKKLEYHSMSGESEIIVKESSSEPKNVRLSTDELQNETSGNFTGNNSMDNKITTNIQLQPTSTEQQKQSFPTSTINDSKAGTVRDEISKRSGRRCPRRKSKDKIDAVSIQTESITHLSQIDVIQASAIYSNTSMYFSSSEDPVKLSKVRTVFQPVTSDSSYGKGEEDKDEESPIQSDFSKQLAPDEQQSLKCKSNEDENVLDCQKSEQSPSKIFEKGKEEFQTKEHPPETHEEALQVGQAERSIEKAKSRTDDASETKHWLMDVIPVIPKNTRYHSFRHKPGCVEEVTEAEAVKYRQEAVKPVFRFLKRQREINDEK